MNIQQFQYVLAVVDLRNFEAAAEKCFVTQSTLSTMIGRFEDEIGIKVFNRRTKPVSITPEGESIIDRLRVIVHEIETLNDVVHEIKGEVTGNLRIGIIPTVAPYLLPLILNEFSERFPQVTMVVKELTTAQIQKGLKIRNLDIGILATPLHDDELIETKLYDEPFLVYDCSGDESDERFSVETLDYSKVCLLQEGHCLRTQVAQICEQSELYSGNDVNYTFESGSMDSLLRITRARKGITIIPYLAFHGLADGEKENVSQFKAPVPVREIGLITQKFFVKKKLLIALQELIQNVVQDLIPEEEKSKTIEPLID